MDQQLHEQGVLPVSVSYARGLQHITREEQIPASHLLGRLRSKVVSNGYQARFDPGHTDYFRTWP